MKQLYQLLLLSFCSLLSTSRALAQFPYFENWKNATAPGVVFGGSPTPACLTSGKTVTIHGGTGYITDAPGDGFLRLTGAETSRTGYVYNNTAFPTDNGFKISFEYFIHGGNGGEGLCFFLFNAATPSFNIGGPNGSLGYAQSNIGGAVSAGVSNGYMCVALDEGGNFSKSSDGKQGGYSFAQSQSVVLRGAGNGSALNASNYPYLTMMRTAFWNSANNPNPNFSIASGAKREPNCASSAYRKVFIEMKPKTVAAGTSYDITVKMMVGGSNPTIYTVINNYTGFTTVSPSELKYGLSATSSDKTDFHEVRNLSIIPYYDTDGSVRQEDYSTTACYNYLGGTGISASPTTQTDSSFNKIPLDAKRWFQLNNNTYGLDALFDSITNTQVNTGYGKLLSCYDAYYPLKTGEEMNISGIKFYDGEGSYPDSMTLSVINSQGQRFPIGWFNGSKYNAWVGPNPGSTLTTDNRFKLDSTVKNIKYLVLTIRSGMPTEMQILGSYKAPPAETIAIKKPVKLKETLGINGFEWDFLGGGTVNAMTINPDKIKAMKSFAGIRHYMDWEKLETNEGKYSFNPVHSGGWGYDVMYQRCKAEGIEVLACLKTIPKWMQDTYPSDQRDLENTPLRYGKNFSDPASYLEQAKVAFQYTARYGRNSNFENGLLTVNPSPRWTNDPVNVIKKGLDLIKYIECDNERNKWWKGRKAYQTAFEYAANLSAFYDGHKNTMGPGVGVKNADSTMIVVIGGLAASTTEYVRGMIEWCKLNRGYKADGSVNLCWDVINYHSYPNDASSFQGISSTRGSAPEVTNIAAVAADFIQMSHESSQNMEVWVTETGYDENQQSSLKAIPVGNRSASETQADWILRTALLYARSGVKRVFFYQTYDLAVNSGNRFASMGLLNKDQTRKPSADFMFQTNKYFGEYEYRQTLNKNPFVDQYELDDKSLYSLVVPDEAGRTANYTLDLGNADSADIFQPTIGSDSMNVSRVATVQGKLTLTVTETPVFVTAVTAPATGDSERVASPATLVVTAVKTAETTVDTAATHTVEPAKELSLAQKMHSEKSHIDSAKVMLETDTKGLSLLLKNIQFHNTDQGLTNGSSYNNFNNLKVYPNPTSGLIRIAFDNQSQNPVALSVYEPGSGKAKKQIRFNKENNSFEKKIDLGELPDGLYLLEISQGNVKTVVKIIKIKGAGY